MSFFTALTDRDEPDHEETRVPAWIQPSPDEIPVAVPLVRELASAPGAALFLQRADVYSDGIVFVLRLDVRFSSALSPEQRDQLRGLTGFGHQPADIGQELRVGFAFADDSRVDSLGDPEANWDREPEGASLTMLGGGGGGDDHRWTAELQAWLWPLPPAGPADLHFVYGRAGIREGSVEIDLGALVAAAEGVARVRLPDTPSA
ncbi:hypothetical protein [Leucobacter triazinivorans]|uniref:Uncharacterized protein n=1 Tax=Leucobacter triazinivorans TaxID=1784719 RepID=A0A4P6KC34_9MICO|nr:hypothetical protein [Leucobacter triazinivorans]QBE47451.1 hypothetical protein EVS81_00195 [Leucobacter triazinivorans]